MKWKIVANSLVMIVMLVCLLPALLSAEDKYPKKPISMVITFGAGGAASISGKMEADALEKVLGQPVNLIHKPGGGTIPGVMSVMNAPTDGYTLLRVSAPSMVTNPLIRKTPFTHNDFIPICLTSYNSPVLYVRADSPYKDLNDFIEAGRKKTMLVGVNQIGAPPHLAAMQLSQAADIKFDTITYKQIPKSILGLMGGHVEAAVGLLFDNKKNDGKIRPLAILDNRRSEHLPDVPTVNELIPGADINSWVRAGISVKKGTPENIVNTLVEACEQELNTAEFKAKAETTNHAFNFVSGPEACNKVIEEGIAAYKPVIEKLGIKK